MGCTSSAQNMVTSNTNSPEKHVHNFEDTDGKQKFEEVVKCENEGNVKNVLPTCDTLAEPIQLARNNKSFVDSSNLKAEKDIHVNGHFIDDNDNMNMNNASRDNHQDKISSLEEIVDRVVELYVSDNGVNNVQDKPHIPANDKNNGPKQTKNESDKTDDKWSSDVSTNGPTTELEDIEEAISSSPSQSENSHATRWEAMADIAAELPPLLAVDPTTGQIYALSK